MVPNDAPSQDLPADTTSKTSGSPTIDETPPEDSNAVYTAFVEKRHSVKNRDKSTENENWGKTTKREQNENLCLTRQTQVPNAVG